eukprot:m.61717 g.61717  ORF g.61717 m.61717 type:complete len:310 (+) comp23020_c1_seq1:70-999(+)
MAEYMNDDAAQQLAQMAMAKKSPGGDQGDQYYENDNAFVDKPKTQMPKKKEPEKKFNVGFDYAEDTDIMNQFQKIELARGATVKVSAETAAAVVSDYVKINTIKVLPTDFPDGVKRKWFYDGKDRGYFEKVVTSCMKGDFLVRKSSSSPGFVLCVNDSGQPVNFTINTQKDGKLEFTQQLFKSLHEVVEYARRTPLKSRINPGDRLRLESAAVREVWFPIGMTRERCEAAVAAGVHGAFVVRLSSSHDKYVLVVNDKGTVCSYSIIRADGKVSFGGSMHDTIEELVEHIKIKPFQSKVSQSMRLTGPAV